MHPCTKHGSSTVPLSLFTIQDPPEQAGSRTTESEEFFTLLPFKARHVEHRMNHEQHVQQRLEGHTAYCKVFVI